MKKLVILLVITVLFVIALSSCKTHQTCPAYGSTAGPHTENLS